MTQPFAHRDVHNEPWRMRAVISIGANMDARAQRIVETRDHFLNRIVAESSVWVTPPWGGVEQDEFLNAILVIETTATPLELLHEGQALEQKANRVRTTHWGPRTLDVDVIQCLRLRDNGRVDQVVSSTEELMLPHPQAHRRAFVLIPWLEADPEARLSGVKVADIVAKIDPYEVAQLRQAFTFNEYEALGGELIGDGFRER